jgi:hypothetical protein
MSSPDQLKDLEDRLVKTMKVMLAEGEDAIDWAATDEARARFRAAWDVARQIGSRVTEAELTALLWAAQ